MTPEQERALIEATTAGLDDDLRDAYQELLALIRAGTPPRDAVDQVVASFAQETAAVMSQAFAAVLSASVGTASNIAIEVSTVQLSQRLYTQGAEVSAVVQSIVDKQVKGFMDARALALELFDGYGFRPAGAEPLQFNPSNPALPKYLREALLSDSGMQGDITRAFAKLQVDNLGTGPLRAAYADVLRAIDGLESGAGQALLDKKLKTAFYERMRYFANRIVRTELHRAYELREAHIIMDDPDIQYVQIRRNPASDSVCICSLIAGRDRYGLGPGVYPKALAPVPGFHPHCLTGDALITSVGRITAVSKRWFDGDIVIITTASGKALSATVNHPILTGRGWVGAGLLDVSDKVVCRVVSDTVGMIGVPDDKHQDVPTSIGEIADSFLSSGEVSSAEVPLSPEDFHGDGVGSDVAVIGAYGKLWDSVDSIGAQSLDDVKFVTADVASAGLSGYGGLDKTGEAFWLTPNCVVCGGSIGEPLIRTELCVSDELSFAGSSFDNAAPIKKTLNASPLDANAIGQGQTGLPSQIGVNDSALHFGLDAALFQPREAPGFSGATKRNPGFNEPELDSISAESVLAGQILEGRTGAVFLDAVVKIDRAAWSGHVYNLQTETGHYTANGIVTHNCLCVLSPRLDLTGKKASPEDPNADRYFLSRVGESMSARIVGSQDKLTRVMAGADATEIYNATTPPAYRIKPVGEVVKA